MNGFAQFGCGRAANEKCTVGRCHVTKPYVGSAGSSGCYLRDIYLECQMFLLDDSNEDLQDRHDSREKNFKGGN